MGEDVRRTGGGASQNNITHKIKTIIYPQTKKRYPTLPTTKLNYWLYKILIYYIEKWQTTHTMENISFTQGNSEDLTAQVIFYLIMSDLLKDEDDDEAASSGDMTLAQLIEFFKNKGKIELSLKMIKKLLLQFNSDINLLSGIKLKDKYDMLAEIKNLINKYSKNIKGINFARDFNNDLINTVLKNNRINKVMSTNINNGDGDVKGAKTVLASLMVAGTALINKAKAAYKTVANKFNKVSEGHSKTTIASGKAKGTLSKEQLAEMSASQLFKSAGKELNNQNIAKGIAGEIDQSLFNNNRARPQQREMDILATARARALDRNAEPVYVNTPQQGAQQRQYDLNREREEDRRKRENRMDTQPMPNIGGINDVLKDMAKGINVGVNAVKNHIQTYQNSKEWNMSYQEAAKIQREITKRDIGDDGKANGSITYDPETRTYRDVKTNREVDENGKIIKDNMGTEKKMSGDDTANKGRVSRYFGKKGYGAGYSEAIRRF